LNKEYTTNNSRLKKEIKGLKLETIDEAIKDLYKYYLANQKFIDFKLLTKNE